MGPAAWVTPERGTNRKLGIFFLLRDSLYPLGGAILPMEEKNLRSRVVVEGDERASHRGYLRTIGVPDEEMGKPFVGIINSWSEFNPGHAHLLGLAQEVKAGVWAGGGVPFEGNTISLCDGLCMGHEGMKCLAYRVGPV